MARKKEPTFIHPVAATEALNGYHNDVSQLLMAVHTAVHFLRNEEADLAKLRKFLPDELEKASDQVRRWYQGNDPE